MIRTEALSAPLTAADKAGVLRQTLTPLEMDMARLKLFSKDPVRAALQRHFRENIGLDEAEAGEPKKARTSEAKPAKEPAKPRGRPASGKVRVTIMLDAAAVERWRATGKGWQTRLNDRIANLRP